MAQITSCAASHSLSKEPLFKRVFNWLVEWFTKKLDPVESKHFNYATASWEFSSLDAAKRFAKKLANRAYRGVSCNHMYNVKTGKQSYIVFPCSPYDDFEEEEPTNLFMWED